MAIVTYVSRRMADAECVGHVKRGIPGVGSHLGPTGGRRVPACRRTTWSAYGKTVGLLILLSGQVARR